MSTATAPLEPRETNGRFAAGNSGGPGNPFGRRLVANREAILNAVGPDEVDALMSSMLEHAMNGNMAAAKLILLYAVGKPQPVKDPDRIDVEEFEVAKSKRVRHAEAVGALLDMPIREAIDMAGSKPILHDDPEEDRLDALEEAEEAAAAQNAEKVALRAEADRVVAHMLEHGDWPKDCAFGVAETHATPEQAAEFRRFVAQCLRDGKLPDESPFPPSSDGQPSPDLGPKTAAKTTNHTVCAAS